MDIGTAFINIRARMDDLQADMRKAAGVVNNAGSGIGRAFGAIGGAARLAGGALTMVGAAVAGVSAAVTPSIVQFENLQAALTTSMGSAEAATAKFQELQQFAATTPFQLAEVVQGFTKLKNMGLDPSIEAMTNYGNMAGAMGKSMNDMIEAVADAATGEFERLKEFGIRASSEGDRVKFTFGGVTTEVGKNAEEIQAYLQGLAEERFGGGMALQAQTLGGAFSNLTDTAAILAAQVGKGGLSDALKAVVQDITGAGGASMDLATALGGVLGDAIMTVWGGIKAIMPSLQALWAGFRDGLGPSIQAVGKAIAGLGINVTGGDIGKGLEAVGRVIVSLAKPALDAVAAVIEYLGPKVMGLGKAFADMASGPIGQSLLPILGTLARIVGTVVVGGIGLLAEALTTVIRDIDNFARGIARLVNGIANLPALFAQMGRQIIDGLVSGFRDAGRIALRAVENLGTEVMAAFRAILGIASPSKVFRDYGEWLAIGLAQGIRGKSPEAVEAMEDLADDLKGIWEGLLTPDERAWNQFDASFARLKDGLRTGALDLEQYNELVRRLRERRDATLAELLPEIKIPTVDVRTGGGIRIANDNINLSGADRGADILKDLGQSEDQFKEFWRDTFRDGFRAAWDGDLSDWFRDSLRNVVERAWSNALDNLADDFSTWLSNILKGNGGTGAGTGQGGGFWSGVASFIGGLFGGAPGFATGGSFRVGGSGGPDSQLIPLRLTPGEMVDIRRPGNDNRGGTTVINLDAGDFGVRQFVVDMTTGTAVAAVQAAPAQTARVQRRAGAYAR